MSFLETSGGILGNPNPVAGQGSSPLNSINPLDIESIEILKDADATAVYGSRGANGIVLITTKRGKPGKTKVNANIYSGIGRVAKTMNMLNTRQYLDMRYEAYRNDGLDFKSSLVVAPDLKVWDTTRYTNWQKELIGGTANYKDIQVVISGGDNSTQFTIGGGQHAETTVFPGDNSDQRISAHASINNSTANQKLKTALSINYSSNVSDLISRDLTDKALTLSPNAPELYDSSGNVSWENWNSTFENPLAYLNRRYDATTNTLTSNVLMSYALLPNLEFKANLGYTNSSMKAITITPLSSIDPATVATSQNTSAFSNSDYQNWLIEPQLNWKHKLGKGLFEVLVGTTFLEQKSEGLAQIALGFSSEALMKNLSSAATRSSATNYHSQYRYNAFFGRINYNLGQKYIFNFTGRRDGSSRFGPGKQFANFGAIGVAWIFSEEAFINNNLPFLSFGKLRTSFGTAGNDQLTDYQYLDAYTSSNIFLGDVVGLTPIRLSNPDYAWEANRKWELGIELGFVNNGILMNLSYFRNRSSNQLVGYPLPPTTGFAAIQGNFPAIVENRGLEYEISTKNVRTKQFSWSTSFNFYIPRNELVAFPNIETFPAYANTYVVGEPLSIRKLYRFTGLNSTTGLYEFEDVDGNGSFDYRDKQTVRFIGQKFSGGLQNSITFKGFQLDFLFQFVKQTGSSSTRGIGGGRPLASLVSVLDRWQKPGDVGPIQRFGTRIPVTITSSLYAEGDQIISDASFIRLKNVSLSYTFSNHLFTKLHIDNIRMFIQSQNLLTISNYNGLDPENQNQEILPPLRVVTAGINLTF